MRPILSLITINLSYSYICMRCVYISKHDHIMTTTTLQVLQHIFISLKHRQCHIWVYPLDVTDVVVLFEDEDQPLSLYHHIHKSNLAKKLKLLLLLLGGLHRPLHTHNIYRLYTDPSYRKVTQTSNFIAYTYIYIRYNIVLKIVSSHIIQTISVILALPFINLNKIHIGLNKQCSNENIMNIRVLEKQGNFTSEILALPSESESLPTLMVENIQVLFKSS